MEKKKMKFHVTITDNETGEVQRDTDACAIIAGINEGKKTSRIILTACGPTDFTEALRAADEAVTLEYTKHPELEAMARVFDILDKRKQDLATENEDTENEEPENEE